MTCIVLRDNTKGGGLYFWRKDKAKRFLESSLPLPQTRLPCPNWHVEEISILIGLHLHLRCNFPGDIYPRFAECVDSLLPRQCILYQPIVFRLVIPNLTPKITCAPATPKSMTCSEHFYSLDILRSYKQYSLGRIGVISSSRSLAC